MMKNTLHITSLLALAAAAALTAGCSNDGGEVGFDLDRNEIKIGAIGGSERIRIASDGEWIASSTDNSWITVTPANGRGTVDCELHIDSALTNSPRRGVVRIENQKTWETREIVVEQEGFDYSIAIDGEQQIRIPNYAEYGTRHFDVKVRSNADFAVRIPAEAENWLTCSLPKLELTGGLRPRETTLRFTWEISTRPEERIAQVTFVPKNSSIELAHSDALSVKQEAAERIVEDTRQGDSVALVGISRTIGMMYAWDVSKSMNTWNNVTLWEEGMEGWTPEKDGRVKSVQFFMFKTKESLPYEVQYLTAAEEISFFSNANSFLIEKLEPGEYITKLTGLRRLAISAYGLTEFPEYMAKLENLEFLDLGANNFQKIPKVLKDRSKFPKLRTLIMNANQRYTVLDLSNTTKENLGGFVEDKFPVELLKRDLDTLVLGVNYLQGNIPDLLDDPDFPYYTQEDIDASYSEKFGVDTLPQYLVEHRIKKVMPHTKRFSINYNRLYGAIPDWLLYHPALDMWFPFNLVFNQEGRAQNGVSAGFINEPANLNYYYDLYPTKNRPTEE